MTGRNTTTSLMSLLGGAAAGALTMYLLDPESGQRRRDHLSETANDALKSGGGKLGDAWDTISEQAKHLAEHASHLGAALASGASVAGEHLGDAARNFSPADAVHHAHQAAGDAGQYVNALGQDLIGRVRGLRERLMNSASSARETVTDKANDVGERARDAVSSARSSVGSWISGEPEHDYHVTAHVVSVAATLALGGAAMYFLDPKQGRSRRAWAGGKVHQIVNETGQTFHRVGQSVSHLANRSLGAAHQLQGLAGSGGPVTAEQLLLRVRSQLGHAVSNASQIQVMTDADGNVELTGKVPAGEVDALLTLVGKVAGVSAVNNRLEVVDDADQANVGQGSGVAPQM